jgi:hypothetical protein
MEPGGEIEGDGNIGKGHVISNSSTLQQDSGDADLIGQVAGKPEVLSTDTAGKPRPFERLSSRGSSPNNALMVILYMKNVVLIKSVKTFV